MQSTPIIPPNLWEYVDKKNKQTSAIKIKTKHYKDLIFEFGDATIRGVKFRKDAYTGEVKPIVGFTVLEYGKTNPDTLDRLQLHRFVTAIALDILAQQLETGKLCLETEMDQGDDFFD